MKFTNKVEEPLASSLLEDTKALALESGRRVGQPGNLHAREFLRQRMSEIGLSSFKGLSYDLPYQGSLQPSGESHEFINLIGVIPGKTPELAPILLGAHYDSVIDAPCADDNATSVALNLAIAEEVMESPLERDLIIAFYDAEEPPYFYGPQMGSTRFYEDHCRDMEFAGVIVTDLIGHDFCLADLTGPLPTLVKPLASGLEKVVFMTGAESDGVFPQIIEDLAPKYKHLKIFPTLNSYIGNLSDHHAFEKAGLPFLFFSCAQGKYYHHELDNLDWINFSKLEKLKNFISDVVSKLDDQPAGKIPYPGNSEGFEIRMIKKVLGAVKMNLALKAFGKDMPKSRKDLDDLIGALVGRIV